MLVITLAQLVEHPPIKTYPEFNLIETTMTTQVTARHILVDTLEEAQSLATQISEGIDFGQLAQQHSKCPSGANGGSLGTFGRGQMVQPFENVSFDLPVGGLSEPVQTQFGYHLINRTA